METQTVYSLPVQGPQVGRERRKRFRPQMQQEKRFCSSKNRGPAETLGKGELSAQGRVEKEMAS